MYRGSSILTGFPDGNSTDKSVYRAVYNIDSLENVNIKMK